MSTAALGRSVVQWTRTVRNIVASAQGPTRGGTSGTSYLGAGGVLRMLRFSVIKPKITRASRLPV